MVGNRFPRTLRITRNSQYQSIWRDGVRLRGATLLVVAAPNGRREPRLGISVAKKKMKKAVDRNRFKRLVREAFRQNRKRFPSGTDYVVLPLRGGLDFSLESLVGEMLQLGAKARSRLGGRKH